MQLSGIFLLAAPLFDAVGRNAVSSYPTAAAKCTGFGGTPGLGLTETGGFIVSVDDYGELSTDSPLEISAGPLTLRLESNDVNVPFKGFLLRLSSKDDPTLLDVSGSLSNPANSPDIQIMESTGEAIGEFPNPGKSKTTQKDI